MCKFLRCCVIRSPAIFSAGNLIKGTEEAKVTSYTCVIMFLWQMVMGNGETKTLRVIMNSLPAIHQWLWFKLFLLTHANKGAHLYEAQYGSAVLLP